ncbi:MAG TPA: hypothetical protein VN048_00225, partial [Verrucomicrobiae bacterium]|nr:hypothetical protein [Verrucomicrobiae bacterium]
PTNGPVTLLDVQFYSAKNPYDLSAVKTGFAAIGQTANDYWNGCSRDGSSDMDWLSYVALTNLINADGTVTGVGLSLANAPGAWDNGVADAMYNTYLYPFNGGNITVTLTSLPAGSYDIYVYGHGNVQGGMTGLNGVYQLSTGGVDYGTLSTATSGTAWDSTNWQAGQQYVLFTGVTVVDGQPVVLTCLPGAGGEALISGIQLASSGSVPAGVPIIANQPANQTVTAGANVTFAVGASGTAPLSYQWSLAGAGALAGATNSTLTLTDVQLGQSGNSYSVLVSNSAGSTNSASAVLTVNPGVSGALLDVQFYSAKNPYDLGEVKTGFAAIGLTTNDYWNGCSRDGASGNYLNYVALNNLTNADGSVTGVGLSLANAPGAWDNGVADAMYNTYLYPFNGGNITVTLTNLPDGTYDIYVYGHGNVQGGMTGLNGVYQLSSGTNNYGTQSTATSGTAWDSTNWQVGQQYVLFSGVTVAGGQPVVLTGLPGVSGEALISGMQITQEQALTNITSSVVFSRPVLKMSVHDGSLIISWQASARGFMLESSPNTRPAMWTPVAAAAVTNATRVSVTLPITPGGQLYRLNHP